MENSAIIVNVSLTASDLEDFYYHNARRSIVMKMLIACALLIFISQLVRIVMVPGALEDGGWKWLLAVIALFFIMHYSNKRNAQKEFKKNTRLHEPHSYIITEDSIHIKGGPFNTIFQWDKLHDMTESKRNFFIWLSKGSAQIVPKRDMTPDEIEKVRSIRKSRFK